MIDNEVFRGRTPIFYRGTVTKYFSKVWKISTLLSHVEFVLGLQKSVEIFHTFEKYWDMGWGCITVRETRPTDIFNIDP